MKPPVLLPPKITEKIRFIIVVLTVATTLWMSAEVVYRVYLLHTYHWERYTNHVSSSLFFTDIFVLYAMNLVAFVVSAMFSDKHAKPARFKEVFCWLIALQSLLTIGTAVMWYGGYLITYDEYIQHSRG